MLLYTGAKTTPLDRPCRLWLLLHLPLSMLAFQLALDWVDPAQTDKWLELPVLALVGLATGGLLLAAVPRLRPAWLAVRSHRAYTLFVLLASILLLWLALSAAWTLIYAIELALGYYMRESFLMLLAMPLIIGFYLPVVLAIGALTGLVSARLLRPALLPGRSG